MFGMLTRLWKVLWRQDMEAGSSATVADLPATLFVGHAAEPVSQAPIEFLRRAADVVAPFQPKPVRNRQLAAQLQCVARLNSASSRKRTKSAARPTAKPKPVAKAPVLKRMPAAVPGAVLNRINRAASRTSADVVDLATVRRAKQIDANDQEIFALFQ